MTETAALLRQTVRVLADGTVIRGIGVPDMAINYGQRGDHATTDHTAPANMRAGILCSMNVHHGKPEHFRHNAGVPANAYVDDPRAKYGMRRTDILGATLPHDCSKHLPGVGNPMEVNA